MGNFLINQKIKKIKKSKKIKEFDSFDCLINWDDVHTSYLNEGQWKTDKDDMVLGHMAIIPFPVLCKCPNKLNWAKITKIKCKDDLIMK